MHPGREVRPLGIAGGKMPDRSEHFTVVVARGEGVKHLVDAGDNCRHGGFANSERFRHEKPFYEFAFYSPTVARGLLRRKKENEEQLPIRRP